MAPMSDLALMDFSTNNLPILCEVDPMSIVVRSNNSLAPAVNLVHDSSTSIDYLALGTSLAVVEPSIKNMPIALEIDQMAFVLEPNNANTHDVNSVRELSIANGVRRPAGRPRKRKAEDVTGVSMLGGNRRGRPAGIRATIKNSQTLCKTPDRARTRGDVDRISSRLWLEFKKLPRTPTTDEG